VAAVIGTYVQANAQGEARRVLADVRGRINRIGNAYWRDRYLKELDTRFGHLMQGVAGAPLGLHQIDEGDDE
jgi:hypothetical protein